MRSYINKLADYRDFEFEHEADLRCPKEYIEKQLRHITRGSRRTEKAEVLQKGDVAVLKLESKAAKFDRPSVTLTVGGGLFDKELEEKLVGRKVGERFAVTVNGEEVKTEVLSATRSVYPEPDDEMVKKYVAGKDDMEGVETVEQYIEHIKSHYAAEKKQETVFGILDSVAEYVLTHTDWEFDEKEVQKVYDDMYTEMCEWVKDEMGTSFEELFDDELTAQTGAENKAQLLEMIRADAERAIASALFVHKYTDGKEPKEIDLNEIYDLDWSFLQDYVTENIRFIEE